VLQLWLGVRVGHAVPAVRVHDDVLVRIYLVIGGEDRRGRADVIHQPDAYQRRRGDPAREQRAVDVAQRGQRRVDERDVLRQELRDLGVRCVRRERDRPLDVTEERCGARLLDHAWAGFLAGIIAE